MPKLQGKVIKIEKTHKKKTGKNGLTWEECIFTIEITGFSKRTPESKLPTELKGKRIKLVRWCCFDWHYKLGVIKTLEPDETEAVLKGTPIKTVFW